VIPPTGDQYVLERGGSRAVITQVAAALREFSVDGVDITEPFPESSLPPFGSGIVLVPWPNRVRDGQWVLDGVTQQLDITEVARHNAIHGLLRAAPYRLLAHRPDAVALGATVFPQHGYPFHLETAVHYELNNGGITVAHGFRNVGDAAAPVAVGTHPFLTIGDVASEDLTLTVHASTRFEVDDRLNPLREVPVEGTDFDLRGGRRLADLHLDDAFGGVTTVDGVSAVLRAPDGREVRLHQDASFGYLQLFTPRDFPKKGGTGLAVAIEPMTAPPDALNSGLGLKWLEPGEEWSASWGIEYVR
jgi:aldose 1-epimerase